MNWNPSRQQLLGWLLVVCLFAFGLGALIVKRLRPLGPVILHQDDAALTPPPAANASIVVDVEGAVVRPGNVRVSSGARIEDAITAAGGITVDADTGTLNFAKRVVDGDRIDVPVRSALAGDSRQQPQQAARTAAASDQPPTVDDDTANAQPPATSRNSKKGDTLAPASVSINSATAAELQALPGIGPTIAQRIVDYRTTNGPFTKIDDLRNVKGIGEKKLAKITPFVKL